MFTNIKIIKLNRLKKISFRTNGLLVLLLFVFFTANVFCLGSQEPESPAGLPAASMPTPTPSQHLDTSEKNASEQPSDRAQQAMEALFKAYPQQIEKVEFRNDDWAVFLRGKWFYFAEGKMLPEDLLKDADLYSRQPFYDYQKELPEWQKPTPEESERFRNMSNNRRENPPRRSPHFFDVLWRINNKSEAYQRVKTIRLFGKSTMVHYLILENLSLAEEEILTAAQTDPEVQKWINSISTVEGWNWRDIAETQSRSFHSYGLAVDLLPRSFGGKETYWLWAARYKPDWWNIPYSGRYHPPIPVIKAFEKYGFIWGGKWAVFDTMHFEYRPEILHLSGIPPEMRR